MSGAKSRRSPEVERLETIVASLQRQLDERRRDPGDLPVNGCGDNSCEVRAPRGMATNGGCRCDTRELRWAMKYWKRVAAFREETIREMAQREAETRIEIGRLMQLSAKESE